MKTNDTLRSFDLFYEEIQHSKTKLSKHYAQSVPDNIRIIKTKRSKG